MTAFADWLWDTAIARGHDVQTMTGFAHVTHRSWAAGSGTAASRRTVTCAIAESLGINPLEVFVQARALTREQA